MKILYLKPKHHYLIPTLDCEIAIDYYLKQNIPLYLDGNVSSSNLTIGKIINSKISHEEIVLKPDMKTSHGEAVHFKIDIELSKEAVGFLHTERENRSNQDISLNFRINIRNLRINDGMYAIISNTTNIEHIIPSSEWISKFCPVLGIGKYSTIEVNHSSILNFTQDKLESTLYQLIDSANESFSKGEFSVVIGNIRNFLERIKRYSNLITEYSEKNINSIEYGDDLNKLINAAFQLISKYQHSHSRKDEELNLNVTKQDAQMALYLSMSLASILSKIPKNGV